MNHYLHKAPENVYNFVKPHSPEPSQQANRPKISRLIRAKSAKTTRELVRNKKEPVPQVTDKVLQLFRTKRNFVQKNVLDVMKSEPVESESVKFIDKASGDTQLLKSSGLIPVYKEKKEFGQVPDYIIKKAREKEEKARRIDEELKASLRNRDNQLSETDRLLILEGLKTNWSQAHQTYQHLPLLIDTVAKKQRKQKIETQLHELERYINVLENHSVIYISDY